MRSSPFNVTRQLDVPAGYTIAVYARIAGARFLAVAPDSTILISVPSTGRIERIVPNPAGGDPTVSDYATGLDLPQGLVFHTIGGTTWLYVSETNAVVRYPWVAGAPTAGVASVVVADLPTGGSHPYKNIALDANDKLYVALGSSCNVCTGDRTTTPERGAIYQYNADGSGGHLFAVGTRNAEGLAILPGGTTLWVVINNRDNIPYPYHDASGIGYGEVATAYVNDHPPDEFTSVRQGGDYGWPYCNPTQDSASGYRSMAFDPAVDAGINGNGAVNCATKDRIDLGFQAHSAPLGLLFTSGTAIARTFGSGAIVAFHGSWNRSTLTGYKLVYVAFSGTTPASTTPYDLVTGWANSSVSWGRPVDVAIDVSGALFITDDEAGAIYRLAPTS